MRIFALCFFAFALQAQTLTVGSATGRSGSSTVRLPITLDTAGKDIAGLEWTVVWGDGIQASAVIGPTAKNASKSFHCENKSATDIFCMLGAMNERRMANGIVTYLDVKLPYNFSGTTGIGIIMAAGSDSDAEDVSVGGISGTISTTSEKKYATTQPANHLVRVEGGIECGRADLASLQSVGDELVCICQLRGPEASGRWFELFTSRGDLAKALPDRIWIGLGETSFTFRVKLIEDPQITDRSILIATAGKDGEKMYSGIIPLEPRNKVRRK